MQPEKLELANKQSSENLSLGNNSKPDSKINSSFAKKILTKTTEQPKQNTETKKMTNDDNNDWQKVVGKKSKSSAKWSFKS